MLATVSVKRTITATLLAGQTPDSASIEILRQTRTQLKSIDRNTQGKYQLLIDDNSSLTVSLDLSYEIEELNKDLIYLEQGESDLLKYLTLSNPQLPQSIQSLVTSLEGKKFSTLITDRDGTVNPYCGRYASSIQSVYNAVFLTRFARACVSNAVILTSAPLARIGLTDLSVSPADAFILAGSKGREYLNRNGDYRHFPIDRVQQAILDIFNQEIQTLIADDRYRPFSLIGSGLQFKFGQTTIARQDITESIPAKESEAFLKLIENVTSRLDPEGKYLKIEDTGKDIEVILTVEKTQSSEGMKDFDKGDGVAFLDRDIPLNLKNGPALICGDTSSDLPMIPATRSLGAETTAVIVNADTALQEKSRAVAPDALFTPSPDALVCALNQLVK